MPITVILDVIIITLLVAAVVYAVILDSHLSATKENYRQLSHLIEQFYQVSQNVQEELTAVQNSEREMHQELMNQIDKAGVMKEELTRLLEKIDQKTHLMDYVKTKRSVLAPEQVPNVNDLDLSESERDLLNALNELRVS